MDIVDRVCIEEVAPLFFNNDWDAGKVELERRAASFERSHRQYVTEVRRRQAVTRRRAQLRAARRLRAEARAMGGVQPR